MRIADFEKVQKLIKVRSRIHEAMDQIPKFRDGQDRVDVGGVEGFAETGFQCHLTSQRDGSGKSVNMVGCYVGNEMADAALAVLANKLAIINNALESYGVDMDLGDRDEL